MTDRRILARRFETERPRLHAIAMKLLGSPADADDAVQETWLRLDHANDEDIENLPAWLTTVVSRVSLDLLRAPRRKREHSWEVEPWRDEPVAVAADPAELIAQSDQVSIALLILLETLSPAERIAFVLHDVFDQPFDEIATVLDDGAVLHADYGTSTQTIDGAQAIAERAVLSGRLAAHSTPILIGGRPGVAAVVNDRVVSIMAFRVEGARIVRLDVLADPDRLDALGVHEIVIST